MLDLIKYLVYGNGKWMNRLCCTDHDLFLFYLTVVPCVLMVGLYIFHSVQNNVALSLVPQTYLKKHLVRLRNVFIVCGLIHLVNSVVSWFVPLYFVSDLLMIYNCYQCLHLVRSKQTVLAMQRYLQGEVAIDTLDDLEKILTSVKHQGVHETLNLLEARIRGDK